MRQTAEQFLGLDPDDRVRLAQRRALNRQLQGDHDLPYIRSACASLALASVCWNPPTPRRTG